MSGKGSAGQQTIPVKLLWAVVNNAQMKVKEIRRRIASMLQHFDLSQQLCGFVLKLRALCLEIFFRIFACAILEIQIAKIFIELLLALQKKIEPRLLLLTRKNVLWPEGVHDQRKQQKHACDQT